MKKLMLATLALAAAFTLSAENYTPSAIPSGLTQDGAPAITLTRARRQHHSGTSSGTMVENM